MDERYDGAETVTTQEQVERYLLANYMCLPPEASAYAILHKQDIDDGINMASFVCYVGDNIADMCHLYERG